MRATACLLALLVLGAAACAVPAEVGSDCVDELTCERARIDHLRTEGSSTGVSASSVQPMPIDRVRTRSGSIEHVDVLLVVGSSPAMTQPQHVLADAVQHFVSVLASGDMDGGGAANFRPATDVLFGVISGRMQTPPDPGQSLQDADRNCSGGSDGELSSFGCLPVGHTFAALQGPDTVLTVAPQLACMTQVGSIICEPPQLLDSALRALWPGEGLSALHGLITFADGTDTGWPENAGFLRDDSLIVVIVVADSDDCSLAEPTGLGKLDPSSLLHRCSVAPDLRFDASRYVNGLRLLRPGAEDLVMYFALAGVPPGLVSPEVLRAVSFENDEQRNAFYDALLASPALAPGAADDRGTISPADDLPRPVCTTQSGPIFPARRLVELARGFGPNGLVQSLCANSYEPAFDIILRSIGRRLGPPAF
jgi:hypothetical protein